MQQPSVSVVAVIVTRDRPATLERSLAALAAQTRRPEQLIVVDNAADDAVRTLVTSMPGTTYLPSRRNLGGAGGFALGMLHALALGADWVWLADDDGFPVGDDVLERLLNTARARDLGLVSPVVVDADDPSRLAFPLRRGASWARARKDLRTDFLPGIAALFNGALFAASTLEQVGVPDLRLFVRGDEVDMHRRVLRSGVAFGTDVTAAYAHPAGQSEWQPIMAGRTQVLVPDDEVKRFFTFRNRGFLTAQRGMRRYAGFDLLRYAWFFLVQRRDPRAFVEWWRLARAGRGEAFRRP
ncbi:MAG TPA: glycosyltransferase family 2 protein [Nocardioidaceae bacterium]|nr:glycosyltransferase family 2 protein [Nocardioidaceae bacterium]